MNSWYEKCMPKIQDIKPYIKQTVISLKKVEGVKSLYIWGSYSKNINKPNARIKDVDVLAKTNFYSGDLLSIDNKIVKNICSDRYLENQGYDPEAIKFSKHFLTFAKYNVDCWAISKDSKLVHWGAICVNREESEDVNKEAEKYAVTNTGTQKNKIHRITEHDRKNWYNHYCHYLNQYFEGMPTGWYKTEDIKIKDILKNAIKI